MHSFESAIKGTVALASLSIALASCQEQPPAKTAIDRQCKNAPSDITLAINERHYLICPNKCEEDPLFAEGQVNDLGSIKLKGPNAKVVDFNACIPHYLPGNRIDEFTTFYECPTYKRTFFSRQICKKEAFTYHESGLLKCPSGSDIKVYRACNYSIKNGMYILQDNK